MTLPDEDANNHCDSSEQTTLLEVDSEFWRVMRELIRAELSHFVSAKKVKWDTEPKGPEFWNESIARVQCIVSKYGYATNQLLKAKDPHFAKEEFAHPQQMTRLLDRVARTADHIRFRLDNCPRSAWYITRKEWLPRAQKKASFEKNKDFCEKVPWASETEPIESEAALKSVIPQGIGKVSP